MMHTITAKYVAPVTEVEEGRVPTICDIFQPGNCAANADAFDGSWYDTNTGHCVGVATTIEDFVDMQVAHPGILAAIRAAIKDYKYKVAEEVENPVGEFTFEVSDLEYATIIDMESIMEKQGVTFVEVEAEGSEPETGDEH